MSLGDSAVRPFRFGVQPAVAPSRAAWLDTVRRIEASGIDVLLLSDHFGAQWGPLASLGAAAVATTRLRLGTLVLDNDFRHPAVLAKELATLDVLSDGRVEIGLGAGWSHTDYAPTGIPFDAASVRVDRLEESARVLRGLMRDGPFSFGGTYYRIQDLAGKPRPIQEPPPILIAGARRRLLTMAGRVADIVGVHVPLGEQSRRPIDRRALAGLRRFFQYLPAEPLRVFDGRREARHQIDAVGPGHVGDSAADVFKHRPCQSPPFIRRQQRREPRLSVCRVFDRNE